MLITCFCSCSDAGAQDPLGFVRPRILRQQLSIHQERWYVSRIEFEKFAEVFVRLGGFASIYMVKRQAVAREGVRRLLGEEFLQQLPSRFLLWSVCHVPYYSGRCEVCAFGGERGWYEAADISTTGIRR